MNQGTWGFALAAVVCLGCKEKTPPLPDPTRVAVAAQPVAPPPLTPAQRLREAMSITDALTVLRSEFKDTENSTDPAAGLLAAWSLKRLTWQSLQALPETKHALVMKDPEMERGKRNCYTGVVIEIEVDRSAGAPIYLGGMMTGSGQVARFAAVGSSGEIVQRSSAKFCGVVTGKHSYSNSGGGMTHAVFLVGMFDLPENRNPK